MRKFSDRYEREVARMIAEAESEKPDIEHMRLMSLFIDADIEYDNAVILDRPNMFDESFGKAFDDTRSQMAYATWMDAKEALDNYREENGLDA